jgi:hypothetical protein
MIWYEFELVIKLQLSFLIGNLTIFLTELFVVKSVFLAKKIISNFCGLCLVKTEKHRLA